MIELLDRIIAITKVRSCAVVEIGAADTLIAWSRNGEPLAAVERAARELCTLANDLLSDHVESAGLSLVFESGARVIARRFAEHYACVVCDPDVDIGNVRFALQGLGLRIAAFKQGAPISERSPSISVPVSQRSPAAQSAFMPHGPGGSSQPPSRPGYDSAALRAATEQIDDRRVAALAQLFVEIVGPIGKLVFEDEVNAARVGPLLLRKNVDALVKSLAHHVPPGARTVFLERAERLLLG